MQYCDKFTNFWPPRERLATFSAFGFKHRTERKDGLIKLLEFFSSDTKDNNKLSRLQNLKNELEYMQNRLANSTRFAQTYSEKDDMINTQKQIIIALLEELGIHKVEREKAILIANRAKESLKIVQLQRDELEKRLEHTIYALGDQMKKLDDLQKENASLRTKIEDARKQFREWNIISRKVSSTLNRDETTLDIENENDNETLKETLMKVQQDKQRLEQELSVTLNELMESRENCLERSKRYEKENENHLKETNTLSEVFTNGEKKVTSDNDVACSTLPCTVTENVHTTRLERTTNELSCRQISAEKNIVQITAQNVYMIEKSIVSVENGLDVFSSQEDSDKTSTVINR